ncbi:hypothetical protein [Vitiosangium sp. GDMCC 1.1324]|uniref:hypothetical protein n=1 Tax=Vitiosangium sp. (strain GDMCC 1.1324) TaxID=2138576 RepID=UPI000D3A5045|nr:hypothetical protein [Vitiosangium sp. GDMCC 1.1324]PTL81222.1 hypothetical protein DAT35_24175 [Vitiosangium sp. GDMCC 1.1324]
MSLGTSEALQRLFAQWKRDVLTQVPPEQREALQRQLQQREEELLARAADGNTASLFSDLIGLGKGGPPSFDNISKPVLVQDFDESVIQTQLHAASELYYIYQHERMKVFQVAGVLLRLFHEGRMKIQRGPGARALYLLEKHQPLRYKPRDRQLAYRRAFNYGRLTAPRGAVVFRNFHREFVAFVAAIAQYFRDLLIGEVIRGSQTLNERPFASQATIQRLGTDMRWQLDRATYGNILALTVEVGEYLKTILDTLESPDIKKSFDANTKWDVIEVVSNRYLGGTGEISQRSKMADAGRLLLNFVADNPFKTRDFHDFQTEVSPLGPVAEEWIAAYRMTPEGASFRGVTPTLRKTLGLPSAAAALQAAP